MKKDIEDLKTKFKLLLGEVHIRYGFIETELQQIWYYYNLVYQTTDVKKIDQKYKKIKGMTLGRLIEEIDFLAIYTDKYINMLKKETKQGRNYYVHHVQEIFYDQIGKTDKENEKEFRTRLLNAINDLSNRNKKLIVITDDLLEDRFKLYKKLNK